jgi:hypothetical protein
MAHKYVDTEKETTLCFEEAMVFSTESELRFLFCSLTMQGFPTMHLFNQPRYFNMMTADYHYQANLIQSTAGILNAFLCDIKYIFAENNKCLSDFGFDEPNEYPTEIEKERMKYSSDDQRQLLESFNTQFPNNDEQEIIYQEIIHCLDSGATGKFFINGQGGCGKTLLAKKILAY